jgi:hypothetical protein
MNPETVDGRRGKSRVQISAPGERRPHEEANDQVQARAGSRRPPGRSCARCSSHEKAAACVRAESVEGRGKSTDPEGAATTMKKKTSKKKSSPPASRKKIARPSSSSAKRIVGIVALGAVINLRSRRIYDLRHEGMPMLAPGRYDLRACLRWYVRFLQRKILERAQPKDDSATAAGAVIRHTILSVEAEMKSIELAEKRERLISVEKSQKDLHAIVREIRKRILALSPKIAIAVVGEKDLAVSQVLIDRTLKSALAELSQYDPDDIEAVTTSSTARSRSRTQ